MAPPMPPGVPPEPGEPGPSSASSLVRPASLRRARRKTPDILVCPEDRGPLLLVDDEFLYNPRLRRAYRIEDGIPVLLVDEAAAISDDTEHQRMLDRASGQPG